MKKSECSAGRLGLTRTDLMVTAFHVDEGWGVPICPTWDPLHALECCWSLMDSQPRSSLVFTARCLSSSATVSSAIWLIYFSMSLMISSEVLSFDFFSLFIALCKPSVKSLWPCWCAVWPVSPAFPCVPWLLWEWVSELKSLPLLDSDSFHFLL